MGFLLRERGAIQRGENATVTASENGFAVVYNHPVWSTVVPKDYLDLKELMGMEIWNTGSLDTLPEDGAAFRDRRCARLHGDTRYRLCVNTNVLEVN